MQLQRVLTIAAVHRGIAQPRCQNIVAKPASQGVITLATGQNVVPCEPHQQVSPVTRLDRIRPVGTVDLGVGTMNDNTLDVFKTAAHTIQRIARSPHIDEKPLTRRQVELGKILPRTAVEISQHSRIGRAIAANGQKIVARAT